jgi:pantoate--beta-alanine ligase
MEVVRSLGKMKDISCRARAEGRQVGLVPTMGYLHEGHMSLVRASVSECGLTVVSIFVNPFQFGPNEDFEKYPRDIAGDTKLLEKEKVDVLFLPDAGEMYPDGYATYVDVKGSLTGRLCGVSRPGHFRGVATVVAKLFNIVRPHRSYFGEKDFQQALVVRRMSSDLDLGVEVRTLPIVREDDGLAMSSRNRYLSVEERIRARAVFEAVQRASETVLSGERNAENIRRAAEKVLLSKGGISIDYIEIVDASDLQPVREVKGRILVALAVFVGKTRLLDNAILNA